MVLKEGAFFKGGVGKNKNRGDFLHSGLKGAKEKETYGVGTAC